MLEGDAAVRREPFDVLAVWLEQEEPVSLILTDQGVMVDGCLLRECSFDPSARRLYVGLYTPRHALEVRDWFLP